jgi:hypothetical protein
VHLPTLVLLAPAAVCVLSWLGVGHAVPRRALQGPVLLDWLTRVAFGSVAVSLVLFALGRAALLDRALIVSLTIAGALAGAWALPKLVRGGRRALVGGRLGAGMMLAVAVALVLDLVAATAPPTSADALKYHLALPKLWLQTGSIGDPFWRFEGFSPSGVEMLFTQGLALGGGSAAAPLHAVFAALCALAVFGLAREISGEALAGAAAAALFVLQGLVTWEATSAFVDLGLAFYTVLAVWHAAAWARTRAYGGAAWTGFFSGAAAGTKYLGLLVAAIVLAWFAIAAVSRRRRLDLLIAATAGLLAGGGWYLKNLLATDNPVYPLFLGGKWLTPLADQVIRASYGSYGVEGGLWRLPLLPVDLLVHGGAFDRGQYVGTGIFLLALLGVAVRRTRLTLALAAGAGLYCVVWWEQSPQARFLLPALAVLAALGGVGAAAWLAAGGRRRGVVFAVLACTAVAWLASSVALTRQLLPVTVGAESREAFLQRLTGTYDALAAARSRAGEGTIGLVGYSFDYNVPGRSVTVDLPAFDPFLSRPVYLSRLRSLGIRAVLVGRFPGSPEEGPLLGCASRVAVYHARYVTSRSLGDSVPFDLVLYSLVRCA